MGTYNHKSHKPTRSIGLPATLTGETLLVQFFLTFLSVAIVLSTNINIGAWMFPCAVIVGILVTCGRRSAREIVSVGLTTIALWTLAMVLGWLIMDPSYDGNIYHQEIIAAIDRGWKPGGIEIPGAPLTPWTKHYAKGLEMGAASVVSFTGKIETGKAVNFILGLATMLITIGFVGEHFPTVSKVKRIFIGLVVVCNPVFTCQALSFYNDFGTYLYTLLTILFLIEIANCPSIYRNWGMLAIVIVLGAATKFTAFFEIGVAVAAGVIWLMTHRRYRLGLTIGVMALFTAIVAAAVINYHPYVTNYLTQGNPLYPLLGSNKIDIMTDNTPPEYLTDNRFSTFFRSLLAISLPSVDERKGGFGPLMPLLLLLSCVAIWRYRKFGGGLPLYIGGWVIASCFFFEQSWWARYICHLWIVVVLATVLCAASKSASRTSARIFWAITVCALISGAAGASRTLLSSVRHRLYRETITDVLKDTTIRMKPLRESYIKQLSEKGINCAPIDEFDPSAPRLAYYGYTSDPAFFSIMELDSAHYHSIIERLNELPFDYVPLITPE